MAVTITTTDLEQPEGELSESLFPGGDFDTLLAGWLAVAITSVEGNSNIAATNQNSAAAAWVYYRAYSHVAQRLASSPVRVATSVDGSVSKEMAQDQRTYFINLAKQWKATFDVYDTTPAPIVENAFAGSLMVSALPRW
jgi:hypothetical protein